MVNRIFFICLRGVYSSKDKSIGVSSLSNFPSSSPLSSHLPHGNLHFLPNLGASIMTSLRCQPYN